jgi:hypothetical protein
MNRTPMNEPHQGTAPWQWLIQAGRVRRLEAANRRRWLAVSHGRVWLTGGPADQQADDVWLETGERFALPAGTEWLLEGWPEAHVELLELPPAPVPAALSARASAWLHAAQRRWLARSRPGVVLA